MNKPITPELLNHFIKETIKKERPPHMFIGNGATIKLLCERSGIIPPIEFKDDVVYQVNPDSWERK